MSLAKLNYQSPGPNFIKQFSRKLCWQNFLAEQEMIGVPDAAMVFWLVTYFLLKKTTNLGAKQVFVLTCFMKFGPSGSTRSLGLFD